MNPIAAARQVEFGYLPGAPVIRGVSLEVPPGKLCALIGANGCGKSTMVRLFAGLLAPSRGEIIFQSAPLGSLPRREAARHIAYVPQNTAMAFPFTALEVVLTGRSPYTPRFRFEDERDRSLAMDALNTVGAAHLAARPVTEVSGGERQMVAVARALAQEPRLLLLDEPSAGLDLKHRASLARTLAALRDTRSLTSLVVTHDLHLIDPLFDHVFALRQGQLLAQGRPAELLTDSVLADIYDDQHVRTSRVDGRTLIWSN